MFYPRRHLTEHSASDSFSVNSSIVGGKIVYQSNAQTRSCSRGISSLLTAAKPGAGSPLACLTTKDPSAGKLWRWHHHLINANGLSKPLSPPRLLNPPRARQLTLWRSAAHPA